MNLCFLVRFVGYLTTLVAYKNYRYYTLCPGKRKPLDIVQEKLIFNENLVVASAIYWRLNTRKFIQIRSDLIILLCRVLGFTFFRTQCMLWLYKTHYTTAYALILRGDYSSGSRKNSL